MLPYNTIHFIGILSPEMASLAMYAMRQGKKVTGSDDRHLPVMKQALEQAGALLFDMYAQVNIASTTELIVLSRYCDGRNSEVEAAQAHSIPIVHEIEFLKLISDDVRRLVILGDYEARLISTIMQHVWRVGHMPVRGLSGTVVTDAKATLAVADDSADWFIIPLSGFKRDQATYEADFLSVGAEVAVLPSIIYDYPELNMTLDDVYQSSYTFVKRIPRKGVIIGNSDFSRMKRLQSHLADRHIETYGFERDAAWHIREVTETVKETTFSLAHDRQLYGPFTIPYHGRLFVTAATAVCITSLLYEMKPEVIGHGLATAPKLSRYLTQQTDREGRLLVDDQADHPEIIAAVLETIRARWPDKRIWCLYQPGSYLRTKALIQDVQKALSLADFIYLTDIRGYPKEKSEGLHIRSLVADMKRQKAQTYYFDDSTDMTGLLSDRVARSDCIVTLGVEGICQTVTQPLLNPA